MAASSLTLWLGLLPLAGALSFGVLWLIGRWAPVNARQVSAPQTGGNIASFLFQDDFIFDQDSGGLPTAEGIMRDWPDLRAWLSDRFAGLPATLAEVSEGETLEIRPARPDDTAELHLHRSQHGTRITLCDPPHACPAERHEMLRLHACLNAEIQAMQSAPYPIWKTSPQGTVLWQNTACGTLFEQGMPSVTIPAPGQTTISRFSITPPDDSRPVWCEVHSAAHLTEVLHHATDITKVVRAETMQKDFVQTLTKTFAYLTIGLAVFDRNRQLALFNPALTDLTSLRAEFLSSRPDLMAFFDNLRNRGVMPEPRNYASWRTQISQVIESAEGGLYQETWSLPNDVTYRVTGRPHPDGAIAFLFEDISAEVMLTRRFRTQLDLRQASLDCLPDAVMVIGSDNVLAFCNSAATQLLGVDPDICFADMTASDLIRACAAALPVPAIWQDVESTLRRRAPGNRLHRMIETADGHSLACQVDPLPGGAHMMTLRGQIEPAARATMPIPAG